MNCVTMLGEQYRRSSFPGSLDGCSVARPFVCLDAMEWLLVFREGDTLRVDRGV